jgi:hypothetical protein
VLNKWDEICAELDCIGADVYCITESWINSPDMFNQFVYRNYTVFGNTRPSKSGGGVLIVVNPALHPVLNNLSKSVSVSNGFNICAVNLLNACPPTVVSVVYRPPNASIDDTKALFINLCNIVDSAMSHIIVGDFNIVRDWNVPLIPGLNGANGILCDFMLDYDLAQLNTEPSRENNLLDLVLVSSSLINSCVRQLPPIAGSDHLTQEVDSCIAFRESGRIKSSMFNIKVNIDALQQSLQSCDWISIFTGINDIDKYVERFTFILNNCVSAAEQLKRRRKGNARDLPRSIVKLIHKKREMWRRGKKLGDMSEYKQARNVARRAIRQFQLVQERSLLQVQNKRSFFKYLNNRLGKSTHDTIQLRNGDKIMTDAEAAETLNAEFSRNFSTSGNATASDSERHLANVASEGYMFNCCTNDIISALNACSNTAAGPDGISFATIKHIIPFILQP